MRRTILLVASLLLILTGCAQQSQLSGTDTATGKNAGTHKRKPILFSGLRSQHHKSRGDDIWPIIEDGLTFAHEVPDHRVERYINWYSGNESYFNRTLARADKYMPYVVEKLQENDMPMELALLPFIESAYNPFAYSHSHASGLWQFIPDTGREMGLKQDWWYEGRRDIIDSTDAAIRYLKILNTMFDGDWLLTLAAYNGGPGTISRAMEANRARGKPTDFWSLSLREETRAYVPQLIALSKVLSDPEAHDIDRRSIPAKPGFTVVEVKDQIDLSQAAKLANISAEEIYHLNPGFSRWVTPPEGPYRLLLPSQRVDGFLDRLAAAPRNSWRPGGEYVVKSGDTLGRIAANHQISLHDLTQLNQLKSTHLQVGQVLRIPGSSAAVSELALNVGANKGTGDNALYRVKAGDSLWSIARNHNIKLDQLLAWNNLKQGAVIAPGQQLRVQGGTLNASAKGNAQVNYQVKRGDSLYDIARRFKVEIKDILAWNGMEMRQMIQPGQSLTLYPGH
ncbi:MAG: LysM peptidoglycan-binding domain-containing protein [Porticoccaceae bacterium]|jgi:membrane-bound lytic murein transglycosylase D|nr:LysM peptidoglycan-binding domain-containing protein [Porticoccaceae bacterium]HLS97166.1 LysM peptidoglycan-binding domain-containing protein [Porticoccaceae bacterium]